MNGREGTPYSSQDKDHMNAISTSSAGSTTINRFSNENGSGRSTPWPRFLYGSNYAVYFNCNGNPVLDYAFGNSDIAPGFCLK